MAKTRAIMPPNVNNNNNQEQYESKQNENMQPSQNTDINNNTDANKYALAIVNKLNNIGDFGKQKLNLAIMTPQG